MPMVEITNLRKEYKNLVAVKGLSLTLEPGDIFGFIGPNGAGKTTTIKMLATLLDPTSGVARVDGIDVTEHPEEVRARIGYMPDAFGVYDDFKVWEYLDFFASAYRIPRPDRPALIDDVLELTTLTEKKESYVEELSRGMKQRLCLAKTLVHDPKVLLLDEPASGLDPRARIEIKELLKELKAMGKTIIISSHILPELADFCTSVGIIERGELIVAGPIDAVMREVTGGRVLEIRVPPSDRPKAAEILAGVEHVRGVKEAGDMLRVDYTGTLDDQSEVLLALIYGSVRVQSFAEQETDLEDIFLRVTKGLVA
uniref:Efflux ABC transporter, ATP-binding protein n=1 Tax=uncultured Armatimonadetes bacterium TaxID=157466 RepID=A0A6J4JCY0_9BACT|nr:Efflux ABC transporter, ATP-binding protein [uncultured Armatimonadetes bacterium]